jgi:hypothetical protein
MTGRGLPVMVGIGMAILIVGALGIALAVIPPLAFALFVVAIAWLLQRNSACRVAKMLRS